MHGTFLKSRFSPGFALLTAVIILGALSALTLAFVAVGLTDIRITQAHAATLKAYYLAEAGTAEMIRAIQDDPALESSFLNGTLSPSNSTITRSGVFEPQGSYTTYATSTAPAVADITSTGTFSLVGGAAQRVSRTSIARATGTPGVWALPLFAGGVGGQQNGNITIRIPVNVIGEDVQANQNLRISGGSAVLTITNGDAKASNNIIVQTGGTLTVINGTQQEGVAAISMPAVDFDSDSPSSLKNRADATYTPAEFNALPSGTTLSGIIYVTSPLTITNQTLTIVGQLAVNGALDINNPGNLITVVPAIEGSGILANGNLTVETPLVVSGVLYSNRVLTIDPDTQVGVTIDITGGVIGWVGIIQGRSDATLNIVYDQALVSTPLDPDLNAGASLIVLNHWEEEY